MQAIVYQPHFWGVPSSPKDHDQVGDDSHEDVGTGHSSQETEIEDQERSGNAPVDVTSPEDLAVGDVEGVRDMVVLLTLDDLVQGNTVSGGHGEVGEGSGEGDDGGDDMIEALGLCLC
jgi:hypothetical protein